MTGIGADTMVRTGNLALFKLRRASDAEISGHVTDSP